MEIWYYEIGKFGEIQKVTKYILHGGQAKAKNKDNGEFFQEFSSGLKDGANVLLNFFSRDESEAIEQSKRYGEKIKTGSKNKNFNFVVASEKDFLKQLKNSDAMFVGGGSTPKLMDKMSKYKNLEKLFKGKVIAGSSAGAYFLVKSFFENDESKLYKGLGILNIKALCHYGENNRRDVKKLDVYKERLPIIILPNHKWIVIYK